jgi:hypothetical protein
MPSAGPVLTVLAFLAAGPALGKDENANAVAKLAQTGAVACQPVHPVFCSNIHVSCAGPSSLKTFSFKLRANRTQGSIEGPADTAGVAQQYVNARVEWYDKDGTVILRPREGNGYVKLLADGSYVIRHYSQYYATMSRGHCR